jgi:hypothetical protein
MLFNTERRQLKWQKLQNLKATLKILKFCDDCIKPLISIYV